MNEQPRFSNYPHTISIRECEGSDTCVSREELISMIRFSVERRRQGCKVGQAGVLLIEGHVFAPSCSSSPSSPSSALPQLNLSCFSTGVIGL